MLTCAGVPLAAGPVRGLNDWQKVPVPSGKPSAVEEDASHCANQRWRQRLLAVSLPSPRKELLSYSAKSILYHGYSPVFVTLCALPWPWARRVWNSFYYPLPPPSHADIATLNSTVPSRDSLSSIGNIFRSSCFLLRATPGFLHHPPFFLFLKKERKKNSLRSMKSRHAHCTLVWSRKKTTPGQ